MSSVQCISVATHLSTFVTKPEAPAKSSEMQWSHWRSSCNGAMRTTKSSAYKEARWLLGEPGKGISILCRSAFRIMEFSAFMVIMNNTGEIGSPYRSPLACTIVLPGLPLSSTLVLAVDSNIEIQLDQRRGKPMCCNISRRNGHATESNAFTMSTLSSTDVN